jgi:threonine aldolase
MDRRVFLQAAGLAAAGAVPAAIPAGALAQTAAPPRFPPMDARSVWLVGDGAPPQPAAFAAKLSSLLQTHPKARDGYLAEGAVGELETAFARHLGKEDCAFFPTGTLANTVAVRVLSGDNPHALVPYESHLYKDESNATQRLAGINMVPLGHGQPAPSLAELRTAIDEAENGPYPLKIGCMVLESPVRRADGRMPPPAYVAEFAALARKHGAGLHLDGARLLLAPPTLDVQAYVAPFDTVYVSLYKYLDAPFGAVLAGSKAQIAKARTWRHIYGGLIYQGWPEALVALDALQGFPTRMAQAHVLAARLFAGMQAQGRGNVRPRPDASNIFEIEMPQATAQTAFERGRASGVRVGPWENGALVFYVNDTLLRRPLEEYLALFAA